MVPTPDDLVAYLEAEARPFEWGVADCAHLVADWFERWEGADLAEQFGEYASEAEADAILDAHGDLYQLVCSVLGPASFDVDRCPLGAAVLAVTPDNGAVLGLAGPPVAFFRARTGHLVPLALERCRCYWRLRCRPS